MKRFATIVFVSFLLLPNAFAQDRVSENQLDGTWKLVFDLDKEGSDSAIGRIALKAVGGLLDEIDVRFTFETDHRLGVWVDAFGEGEEQDDSTWEIDRHGRLHLGETDAFDTEDAVWMWEDERLRAFENGDGKTPGEAKGLYLTRVDG